VNPQGGQVKSSVLEPGCSSYAGNTSMGGALAVGRGFRFTSHPPIFGGLEDLFVCIGMKKVMKRAFLTTESYLRVNNPKGILEYIGIQ